MPTPTFKDKPASSDILSTSQGDIQGNFEFINTTLGKDHQIAFNDLSSKTFEGRHIQVSLNNRHGSAPTVGSVSDGTDLVIYSDNGNLFSSSSINNGPFQLTNIQNNTTLYGKNVNNYNAVGTDFTGGYVFIGPLIFQYGNLNHGSISPSSGILKFPISFTNASSINVILTPISKSGGTSHSNTVSLIDGTITTTQFQWNWDTSTSAYVGFTWVAMGF